MENEVTKLAYGFGEVLDLLNLSSSEVARLSSEKKLKIDQRLNGIADNLKALRAKFDEALAISYEEKAREALHRSGRDFGTAHVQADGLRVKYDLPKKVTWDQEKLEKIAKHIAESGEKISDFIDVKYSVAESRYTNWPEMLKSQFSEARTVKPGKPSYTISLDGE